MYLHQRRFRVALDEIEDDDQRQSGRDRDSNAGITPTPYRRLLESEDTQGHAAGDQHETAVVHSSRHVLGERLGNHDQYQGDKGYGNIHPEDGSPRPFREVAAQNRTEGGKATGDAEEDRQRFAALAKREGLHDDGQGGGEHDGTAGPLNHTERHDPRFGNRSLRGQSTHRRRRRKENHTERHHFPVTDGVGEAPAKGEECRQRKQVAVYGPLDTGARQAELLLNLRHRDRHNCLVDEGHRYGKYHRGEYEISRSTNRRIGDRHSFTLVNSHGG